MKQLFTDASFDYRHTGETAENYVRGKICIFGQGISKIEKVVIGKVEGLKQYINILELTAIARAVEIASKQEWQDNSLQIFTDSMTAMYWARAGKIKKKGVSTAAHESALDYLRKAKLNFNGIITFNFLPRDKNPAGKLLEAELERERPHAI